MRNGMLDRVDGGAGQVHVPVMRDGAGEEIFFALERGKKIDRAAVQAAPFGLFTDHVISADGLQAEAHAQQRLARLRRVLDSLNMIRPDFAAAAQEKRVAPFQRAGRERAVDRQKADGHAARLGDALDVAVDEDVVILIRIVVFEKPRRGHDADDFAHSAKKRYSVRVSYFSPAFSTQVGKSGLWMASG